MKLVESAGLIATSFRSLPPFELHRPAGAEAAARLAASLPRSAYFAGGTDLVAQYNEGWSADHVIDLSRLKFLRRIERQCDALLIGALVTHWNGARSRKVRGALPGFAAAWARIANVRVRMAATLGGNLMARRTRYESPVLLSAAGATLEFVTAAGPLSMPVSAFLASGAPASALLESVRIPLLPGMRFDYERSPRPIATQALALWAGDEGRPAGRVALATEHVFPRVLDLDLSGYASLAEVRGDAHTIAARSFEALPADFADPVTGNAWLRRAGAVLLSRQLKRTAW
ncbi:MAG: dehydrogenase [Acidobacteria bacterium]|nr:dehydrogenase [Acidobacteriota bacterium]